MLPQPRALPPQPTERLRVLRHLDPWLEGASRNRGLAVGFAALAAAAVMGVSEAAFWGADEALRTGTPIELDLRRVFEGPTVTRLAAVIEEERATLPETERLAMAEILAELERSLAAEIQQEA